MKHRSSPQPDPFASAQLRPPSLWQSLKETFGGKRRLLDVAQIEVTSLCPGKCSYCPHSTMGEQWKGRHMRPETYVRLWPLFLETTRVHLQGWGEPLIHPRFLDMVELARRADCLVSTTTCGLIMDDALAVELVLSGLDIIAFSLTGTSPESNDAARAGVNFSQVMDSIRRLQAVRRKKTGVHLEIHLAYLMLAGAVDELRALPELMADLGVHAAVVSTLDYLPAPEWASEAFAPHETQKIEHARRVLDDVAGCASDMGMAVYYALPCNEPQPTCLEHPQRSVYVDAEGVLAPCIYRNLPTSLDDPQRRVFGSCLRDNPLELWRGNDFCEFRAAFAARQPDAVCASCPKRYAVDNRAASSWVKRTV